MKRPVVALTFAFCWGIFIASLLKISLQTIYSLALMFLFFSFLSIKKELRFDIFIFCLVLLLGMACLTNAKILPQWHILRFTSYKNNYPYIVRGFIDSQPVLKNNKLSFIFKTQEIQFDNFKYSSCGNILVYVRGKKNLIYGEELILAGNLYRPFGFGGNNRKSYRDYLYNQGIRSIMNVRANRQFVRLNKNKGHTLMRFALWLKAKMSSIISQQVSPITACMLDAMILGDKRNIPSLINNAMIKSGTVHILVVSGFNVGIVSFVIILFLRLVRMPRLARFCIATTLLLIYCLMTGASNPVVRATVMAIVFMFSYFVKREPDIYNSCAVAAIFILGFNPRQLFDVGFQLSFASVISIVYFYPIMKSLLFIDALKIKYLKFIIDGFLVSFSAWLGTMGFVAYYFKIFSPITVLANIFIVPLATLITLCGFSLIVMAFIFPPSIPLFASSCELLVTLLLNINSLLIKVPGAYFYL